MAGDGLDDEVLHTRHASKKYFLVEVSYSQALAHSYAAFLTIQTALVKTQSNETQTALGTNEILLAFSSLSRSAPVCEGKHN
jgi:enamine deaminase RidA (YjgF/YER057c/UK114 family)